MLTGAYGVSTADALGYGIVLQAVEIATAVVMGMPALLKEGLSWRDVRLRALHSTPVRLQPLPAGRVPALGRVGPTDHRLTQARRASGPAREDLRVADAWVYVLRCADGSLYTGWTVDLERRLAAHAAGTASRYTRSRLPVALAARWAKADRSAALREEARIKAPAARREAQPARRRSANDAARVITTSVARRSCGAVELRAEQLVARRRAPGPAWSSCAARLPDGRRATGRRPETPRRSPRARARGGQPSRRAGQSPSAAPHCARLPASDAARSDGRALAGRSVGVWLATTSTEPAQMLV